MYETNKKISVIVKEIRNIRLSKLDENKKQTKCSKLREEFEKIMHKERKIDKVMKECQ